VLRLWTFLLTPAYSAIGLLRDTEFIWAPRGTEGKARNVDGEDDESVLHECFEMKAMTAVSNRNDFTGSWNLVVSFICGNSAWMWERMKDI
jgi:hypothetical protein